MSGRFKEAHDGVVPEADVLREELPSQVKRRGTQAPTTRKFLGVKNLPQCMPVRVVRKEDATFTFDVYIFNSFISDQRDPCHSKIGTTA